MVRQYILSIDQGTSSSRAILFDKKQNVVGVEQTELPVFYPEKGWVEQDPLVMMDTVYQTIERLLTKYNIKSDEIAAIGITNQRETTIVWDKNTGRPLYNAIVWQDARTQEACSQIKEDGYDSFIKNETGLVVDSYFSATKLKWILDKYDPDRKRSRKGDLLFGTVDTWILWNITKGESHLTDYSNASRTMLFDINKKKWSHKLMSYFDIPIEILPQVKDTSGLFGYTSKGFLGYRIPIASMVGDQQSSLFGHHCVEAGMVKNTYGTGCFMLMNTGDQIVESKFGLISTIAWHINGKTTYALEGSVFIAGAVIQWLRDQMGLIKNADESEVLAKKVKDNNGVYFVPAFTGLGAPYWDGAAQGAIFGLTRDSNKNHIVRAALESMAFQTKDILISMINDSGINMIELYVDGGAVKNDFLMQFQSDILNAEIKRPKINESTSLGTALLAGIAIGFYDYSALNEQDYTNYTFVPNMNEGERKRLYKAWKNAINSVKLNSR
ncbi:MAG: glycerol kinase GlpK [Bacteroidales bacterium]|nr:glycerol kinase GlpK [Bacteroidales bacterium]